MKRLHMFLVILTVALMISPISNAEAKRKKKVPPGKHFQALQEQIDDLQGQVDNIQSQALQEQIVDLQGQVDNIQSQALQEQIVDLQDQIDNIQSEPHSSQVVVGDLVIVPTGEHGIASVSCPEGTVATGGGFSFSNVAVKVHSSGPQPWVSGETPNRWLVTATNTANFDVGITAAVICSP